MSRLLELLQWCLSPRFRRVRREQKIASAKAEFQSAMQTWASTSQLTNKLLHKWPFDTPEEQQKYREAHDKLAGPAKRKFKRAFDRLWGLGYLWYVDAASSGSLMNGKFREVSGCNSKGVVWDVTLTVVKLAPMCNLLAESSEGAVKLVKELAQFTDKMKSLQ